MNRSRASRAAVIAVAATGALTATSGVASAESPPTSWTNLRTMNCDGGVFTSFHVVGSSDVIVPKRVEVVLPGTSQPITTLHVPGFDKNGRDVVTCRYVDPAGLAVTIVGIRT